MASILIAFGLSWMVVAALIGLHLGVKHVAHIDELGTLAAKSDLAEFQRTLEAYKWRSSVHGHSMLFSLSAIVVGLVLPGTGYSPGTIGMLASALMAATVVWTASSLRRIRPLMGLADITFACTIATTAWGVAGSAAA